MQEDAGSVDNGALEAVVAENNQEAPEKKPKAKKKSRIPTVDEIVRQEGEAEENVQPQAEEQSAATSENAGNQDEVPQEDESELEKTENERIETLRSELNLDGETALLETVLFLESEPQSSEVLSKITRLDVETVNQCVERLREKYANADSGIEISQIVGGWILTPKKECFDLVKERYGKRNEGRLSKAAIETLSIIAYSQPITRAEIESIRHVSADNMMKILIDRKFIKEVGKKDIPGKPTMYGTTKEFLEFFHLQSIADLPQLDEKESERFDLAR